LAALLLAVSAKLLLPSVTNFPKGRVGFIAFISTMDIYYIILLTGMKQFFMTSCYWRDYGLVTSEECLQQLGGLGDQRLYYPLSVALFFGVICFLQRRR
jgi:hypothetical protein